jgi:hypothetical protein
MAEPRISIIGTKQSGKTTMIGLLDLACSDRHDRDPNFIGIVEEKGNSNAMDIADMLCIGQFPPRTPVGQVYEADFVMHQRTGSRMNPFGVTNRLRLPVVEGAGEDYAKMIAAHRQGLYKGDPSKKYDVWNLFRYILQSVGFIMIADCTEIPGLGFTDPRLRADTNIARLLSTIVEFKEASKSPPITGIALIFTKYDQVMVDLKGGTPSINLNHPDKRVRAESTQAFMSKHMRNTNRLLDFYVRQGVVKDTIILPSWVNIQYDADTAEPIIGEDGKFRVKVDHDAQRPSFGIHIYDELINWLLATFTA